jgi:hypothetical protein
LPLRLRRTFDTGAGVPGAIAGSPAARILVDGQVVGWFPPAAANPARRWEQQEAVLALDAPASSIEFEIAPVFDATSAGFGESAWEVRGGWIDAIYADGFEADIPADGQ